MSQKNQQNSKFLEQVRQRNAQQGRKGLRRRGKRWLHPVAIERSYLNYLVQLIDDMEEAVVALLFGRLPQLHAAAEVNLRVDDFVDDIEEIMQALLVNSGSIFGESEQVASGIGTQISSFNDSQYRQIIQGTLGVNPLQNDPYLQTRLKAFTRQNAILIKSLPANALKDIEGIASRGLTGGKTVNEIQGEIRRKFDTTRARARLIARDQTSKLNAQLTEVRQKRIGIKEYIWNDASDERVRDSHSVLDGMICSWDDATIYRRPGTTEWLKRSSIGGYIGHPGTDFQCRCWAEPVLGDIIDDTKQ